MTPASAMRTAIIIPARYASKRFPGKPLFAISGKPLIQRVYEIGCACGADEVCVATDDQRIYDCVASFGGKVCMTSPDCSNGSERVWEAAAGLQLQPEILINLQGDAVLTPPWVLSALVEEMRREPRPPVATPAVQLSWEQLDALSVGKAAGTVGGTLVVFDAHRKALYFSRSLIPHLRRPDRRVAPPLYRHIGTYAYTRQALEQYLTLPPSRLEAAEQLEQLRLLEAGIEVRVVPVDYRGRTHWSVDTPEDARIVEQILQTEGELLAGPA